MVNQHGRLRDIALARTVEHIEVDHEREVGGVVPQPGKPVMKQLLDMHKAMHKQDPSGEQYGHRHDRAGRIIDLRVTYEQYQRSCFGPLRSGIRRGQHAFNLLYEVRPDLSENVRGNTLLDPFYRDDRLSDFLAWVQQHWSE